MRYLTWFACVLLVVVSSCVTPTVTEKPAARVDFTRFKTVSYKVHDLPNTEYGSDQADLTYGKETIDLFDTLLAKKLKAMGYQVDPTDAPPELSIDVAVTAVKPGSAAARFWVGFGAGRALLIFDASFKDGQGVKLASFEGGRSYTGMEFGKAFANRGEISTFAATRSVDQIQEFMNNGGAFPR